jgi:hypothetical protein
LRRDQRSAFSFQFVRHSVDAKDTTSTRDRAPIVSLVFFVTFVSFVIFVIFVFVCFVLLVR